RGHGSTLWTEPRANLGGMPNSDLGCPGAPLSGAGGDPPLRGIDADVVDRREPLRHQAALVELPVLVAVRTPPLPRLVAALVLEAHRDPVPGERPERLLQPVALLAGPLALQERPDLLPSAQELVAVSPLRVLGVGEHHAVGVAGVPGVLGGLHLGGG